MEYYLVIKIQRECMWKQVYKIIYLISMGVNTCCKGEIKREKIQGLCSSFLNLLNYFN